MIVQPCYPDIEREKGVQYQKFELWHGLNLRHQLFH